MELARFGAILARWRWLLIAIIGFTAIVSAIYPLLRPSGWKATTQVLVNPLSNNEAQSGGVYYDVPYYQELTAEYILDDYSAVIQGNTFSEEILSILAQSPDESVRKDAKGLTSDVLAKQFTVNRVHRLLKLDVNASSRAMALAIASAADQLIVKEGPTYFAAASAARSSTGQATAVSPVVSVSVADAPNISAKPSVAKDGLFWLLRTIVGVVAAIALVLVLNYFDAKLYDEADVANLVGLPVLGTVHAPYSSAKAVQKDALQTPTAVQMASR